MNANYWREIENCIEYIDAEAYRGASYSEIVNGLEIRLNTRSRVVRDAFNACMPYRLGRYIRRRLYTVKFLKWKQNPVKLTVNGRFAGVKKFSHKFANEFGFEIREDLEECDLQPKLQVEEIQQMYQALENMPVVKSFRLSGDMAYIEGNDKEEFKQMLRFKSYFLPECMESKFRKLDQDAKMLFLIATTHAIDSKNGKVCIPLEQLHTEMDAMKFYDFRSYHLLNNGHMAFVPKLAARYYKYFIECCEELLPDIKAVIPESSIYGDLKKEVDVISDADTLEEISKTIGISDPRPLVWRYLNWGYLRLRDPFAITLYS